MSTGETMTKERITAEVQRNAGFSLKMEHEELQTDWHPGITQKHYDLAIKKAVSAERERCIRILEEIFDDFGDIQAADRKEAMDKIRG
jgi:hypothetical protein